ncbi:12723_t:CDS:2, partial [Funneliformis caledonium]
PRQKNSIIRKEFEDIFAVSKVNDREQKRKCSLDNPFVHLIYEDTAETPLESQSEGWWTERLINYHIRYQSPLANHTWYGLIETADKIWLGRLSNEPSNFAVMLKCMFVFQQLREEWCIDKFDWEILHPNDLPVGNDYYGYLKAIPIGKRLSSFFSWLHSNHYNCTLYLLWNSKCCWFSRSFLDIAIFAYLGLISLIILTHLLQRHPGLSKTIRKENYNAAIKNSLEQVHQLEFLIYPSADTALINYWHGRTHFCDEESIDPITFVVDSEGDEDFLFPRIPQSRPQTLKPGFAELSRNDKSLANKFMTNQALE